MRPNYPLLFMDSFGDQKNRSFGAFSKHMHAEVDETNGAKTIWTNTQCTTMLNTERWKEENNN